MHWGDESGEAGCFVEDDGLRPITTGGGALLRCRGDSEGMMASLDERLAFTEEEEEELRGALAAADGVEADCGLGEGKVRAWLGSSDAGGSKALRASDNSLQSESTGVGMNGIVWADDVGRKLVDRRRLAATVCATQIHSHTANSPQHPARLYGWLLCVSVAGVCACVYACMSPKARTNVNVLCVYDMKCIIPFFCP